MFERHSWSVPLFVGLIVAVSVIGGPAVVPSSVDAQTSSPSVSQARNLASNADVTEQSVTFDIPLPPQTISCTLDTSQMRQYGVNLQSVSVSGTDKLSLNVNSNGNVDMTVEAGSGEATATVTMRVSTDDVTIPDSPLNHTTKCGGGSTPAPSGSPTPAPSNSPTPTPFSSPTPTPSSSSSQSIGQIFQLVVPVAAQQSGSGFTIEETGIQDTDKTQVQSDDSTIQNDTTLTQSIDLDLVVPDDGDSDGDTYTVTIDTSDARAHGINVTGVSVQTDPSGSNALVEVVNTTVTPTENVTFGIREAAADRSNGNISRETITVGLQLDSTQHAAGTFIEDSSITHVISDTAGNTTSAVTFASSISDASGDKSNGTASPLTLSVTDATAAPNSTVTVEFNVTNTNSTAAGVAVNVTGMPTNWTVTDHTNGGADTYKSSTNEWVWFSLDAGSSGTPTLTLSVPNSTTPGQYTITGSATTGEFTTTATGTVTISKSGAKPIDQAIAGGDNTISTPDLLNAINYWQTGSTVPNTNGKTIDTPTLLNLIDKWQSGETVK